MTFALWLFLTASTTTDWAFPGVQPLPSPGAQQTAEPIPPAQPVVDPVIFT
jgi:hypothetical protein